MLYVLPSTHGRNIMSDSISDYLVERAKRREQELSDFNAELANLIDRAIDLLREARDNIVEFVDVIYQGADPNLRFKAIKAISDVAQCTLFYARDIIDLGIGKPIVTSVNHKEAEYIIKVLKGSGVTAVIRESKP